MGWKPQPRWDGRRYRVKIRGKTYSLGTDHAEAHRRFAQLYKRLTGLEAVPIVVETVSELIEAWQLKHGTEFARQMLQPFAIYTAGLLLDDINDDTLTEFHASLLKRKRPLSAWSQIKYIRHAHKVLDWAKSKGLISTLPTAPRITAPAYRPRDLAPQQLRDILAKIAAETRLARVGRLIRFVLATGCRPGEARNLRWHHVSLEQRVCQLPPGEHKTGHKTGAGRTIYLGPDALAILGELADSKGSGTGYVFVSRLGTPYTRDGLRAICARLGCYPYQLRHTAAQTWVDHGADIGTVSAALGHKSTDTTRRYAEVRDQRVLSMLNHLPSPLAHSPSAEEIPANGEPTTPTPEASESPSASRGRARANQPTAKQTKRKPSKSRRENIARP